MSKHTSWFPPQTSSASSSPILSKEQGHSPSWSDPNLGGFEFISSHTWHATAQQGLLALSSEEMLSLMSSHHLSPLHSAQS